METEKVPASRFIEFLKSHNEILTATLGVGALPAVLALVVNIGPPWPEKNGVTCYTTLIGTIVLMCSYVATSSLSLTVIRLRSKQLGIAVAIALFVYAFLSFQCVYAAPDFHHREVRGFVLEDVIRQTLEAAESQGLVLTLEELVEGAEWDPEKIWIPWTVRVTRWSLLVVWLLFYGGFSTLIALLVRFLKIEQSGQQDQHVARLPLPRSARSSLEKAGIRTINDLTKRRREELLAIPGIGAKSLAKVEQCLDALGLSLQE